MATMGGGAVRLLSIPQDEKERNTVRKEIQTEELLESTLEQNQDHLNEQRKQTTAS